MKYDNKIFWIFVVVVAATAIFDRGNCAKLYILEENSINKVTPYSRSRRQTHPASTIAKLRTQDNNVFTPIVGPTQSSDRIHQNNLDFSSSDTLVDYLLPPNPNAQFTSLNFQDPSANLQNIDNFFDGAPTSSSSNTVNSFQPIQNQFKSSPGGIENQISITSPNMGGDFVRSLTFEPTFSFSSSPQSVNPNQFIQNKESSPLNRELNNGNQFKNLDQFKSNSNFIKNDPINSDQSNQNKWDFRFDVNDILTPPKPETSHNEYDSNRFKKPTNIALPSNNFGPANTVLPPNNFSPPNTNLAAPSDSLSPPSIQFSSNNNQFFSTNHFNQPNNQFQSNEEFFTDQFTHQQNNFKQFNPPQPSSNNQFVPSNIQFAQQSQIPASNNQISVPNFSSSSDQTDITWETQKQATDFIPTTSAPFLPTIPPNQNQNQINYQQNKFNNGQNLEQFPSTPLNTDQIYQLSGNVNNQNFASDTSLTSQFDSFLPQGTVSDHSFSPVNENVRHFQHKRQTEEEEEHEEEAEEPIYKSQSQFKSGPSVYSFVKTDKNGHFKWSVRRLSRR